MAINTEKLLKLSQLQTGLQAAKNYTDAEVKKVDDKVTTNTSNISTLQSKVATLEANGYDDTEVRGLISANTSAIEAIEADYLKAADKTALQEQINANESAIQLLTNGVDSEKVDGVNDLIAYVEEHGAEVTGMQGDIADNASAIEALQSGKADKATTLAGYGITDAYTKSEVDSAVNVKANASDVYTKSEVDGLVADHIALTDISAETTGTGNAVTAVAYDNTTGKITVTKGATYLTESDVVINVATDEEVSAVCTAVFGA